MISIRELKMDDDLAPVLALCRDFFVEYQSHHRGFFDTDDIEDGDLSQRFRDSLTSDDSATILALEHERIIGYASMDIREQPKFYKIKRVGVVSALMVARPYRRSGVASLILDEAKAMFRLRGVKYLTLYTAAANRGAIRLYEKLGMHPLHLSFLGEA